LAEELGKAGLQAGRVRIAHCNNESAAQQLRDVLQSKYPNAQITIHKLRGLCSFYAEKGGLLIGYEKQ
jgi:fatty acid-binding protein DegV